MQRREWVKSYLIDYVNSKLHQKPTVTTLSTILRFVKFSHQAF